MTRHSRSFQTLTITMDLALYEGGGWGGGGCSNSSAKRDLCLGIELLSKPLFCRRIFAPAVREFLNFEGPGDGTFGDLTAINIQRGRDHGLPGYTKYLEALLGRSVKTFGDISDLISKEQIVRLKSVYTNVFDIDFFVGGISENPDKGSVLGPTFTKLIMKQFRELREGDRFWYERKHELGFTLLQLTEIRKVLLSRVFCDNVHLMQFTSRYVFRPARRASNCGSLPSMDLKVFSEGNNPFSLSSFAWTRCKINTN